MTVAHQINDIDVSSDRFPVGMKVLAVDDDPICLKVIESLLRKCQYQVTTTNQAVKALKMLRENKNMVDLVISDVNMPDMDGFKLLELVGLEMDLPVIMLSAHSDTELVMKGINHGACDYLLKPVRIEELKNIWQHVVRKKKPEPKKQSRSAGHEKASMETSECGNGTGSTANFDCDPKSNKKRKDQDQDEDEEDDESDDEGRENEDHSSTKKPRIVWAVELHQKFVDAVQHLGYDKAFPKKILDLMNVEGLTRENVASHLQKYRQFIKKMDAGERQKASTGLPIKDLPSFMGAGILGYNEIGDLRPYSQSIRLPNTPLSHSAGMFGRFNSPVAFSMRGAQSTAEKYQPSLLSSQTPTPLFQGFPSSLELSHFRAPLTKPSYPTLGDLNARHSALLPSPNSSTTPLQVIPSNLQPGSSNFLDHNRRCSEPWQSSAAQSSTFALTSNSNGLVIPPGFSSPSSFSAAAPLAVEPGDLQRRDGLLGNVVPASNNNFTLSNQPWEGGFANGHNSDQQFGAFNPPSQTLDQNNGCDSDTKASIFGQLTGCSSSSFPGNEIEKLALETTAMKPMEDNSLLGHGKALDSLVPNYDESLEDILTSLMNRDQSQTGMVNGEFGFDNYPLGSCM